MRSARVRLEDIVEAIDGIEQLLAGAGLQDFSVSWPMQRAVERGLEIISEAAAEFQKTRRRPIPACHGLRSPESGTFFGMNIIA